MSRYFTATLLLRSPWPLDIDRIARTLAQRFPGIGAVDALPGNTGEGDSALLTIDHANVVIESHDHPVERGDILPPLKILRTWNPTPAQRSHQAHLTITCGGNLAGLEGALAYSAATHFVATGIAAIVHPLAILWGPARALLEPGEHAMAAETLLTGTIPHSSWVSYAPVVAQGYPAADATGMVTYGLRPFIGHELELAPRPGDPRSAYRCLGAIVRRVLRGGIDLRDGLKIVARDAGMSMTVRERRYWLRRDESAFVLIAGDSVIDPWTLQPRTVSAA